MSYIIAITDLKCTALHCTLQAHASGKIPRTKDRRDPNAGDKETLVARVIDRVVRPLFPVGYVCETQVKTMQHCTLHVLMLVFNQCYTAHVECNGHN
jgi:hypothetical protein